MNEHPLSRRTRYTQFFIVIFAAAFTYQLPYLRYSYYEPMRQALELSHTDFGLIMSLFGLACVVGGFPGGLLADKFKSRYLLSFAMLGCGLLGFWFATFPPMWACALIYFVWGILGAMVFWEAAVKSVRYLATSREQGIFFGLFEGGRGLFATVLGLVSVFVFGQIFMESVTGMRTVILMYSAIYIVAGLACLIFMKNEVAAPSEQEGHSIFKGMTTVLKMPLIWLLAITFLCIFSLYTCLSYITPFLQEVLGASASLAGLLGVIRTWGIMMLAGPIAGVIADKVFHSSTKGVIVSFALGTVSALYFVFIKESAALVAVSAFMLILAFAVYCLRGLFYAMIDEYEIPLSVTGIAVGVISTIGYSPDMFVYPLVGHWLDSYPGIAGYRILFVFMLILALVGLSLSIFVFLKYLRPIMKRKKASRANTINETLIS